MSDSKVAVKDARKVFMKQGACSSALMFILNREFGRPMDKEVRAAEPLAGGILQQGYQCGMLWGSSLAVGAESYHRSDNLDQAVATAITATQHLMESFVNRTKHVNCFDITCCDWTKKIEMAKFLITGKFLYCFRLIENWAPEAIESAYKGLTHAQADSSNQSKSCAYGVVKKMKASDQEAVMVAGFAGGIGLSGNACGALGAAIWLKSLQWSRVNPGKLTYKNPAVNKIFEEFQKATDYKFLCCEISGQEFKSMDDHTEYINNGGCNKLMEVLAGA